MSVNFAEIEVTATIDTTLCDRVCQWLATGRWFSSGTAVSSSNKTDCHNIAEILLIVELSTINQNQTKPATIDTNMSASYVDAIFECDKKEQLKDGFIVFRTL